MSEFLSIPTYVNGRLNATLRPIDNGVPLPGVDCFPIALNDGMIAEKGVRKDVRKICELQEQGTFPRQLELGSRYLQDRSNGGRYLEYRSGESPKPYFLKVRGSEVMKEKPSQLRIVSGPCLFSVSGASVSYEDGESSSLTMPGVPITKPVTALNVNDRITPYETESLERLTRTIGEYSRGVDIPATAVINIPRTEYYLYILDAYNNGLITTEIATEWFDAVDARSARLRNLFTRRLKRYAGDIPTDIGNINDPLAAYVRDQVSRGEKPALEECVRFVGSTNKLAREVVEVMQPATFNDLNYVGYVYEEIANGVIEDTAAVAVENPSEEMIYVRAQQVAKSLPDRDVKTMAVYPYPQVTYEGNEKGYLYFVPGKMDLAGAKAILQQYR